MEIKSTKTDDILKSTQKTFNKLLATQNKVKTSSSLTTQQFVLQNRNLLQMEKTSKSIASNMRIAGLALKGLIVNKAFTSFQNILKGYGSTSANFSAMENKDSSINVKALERAFQLNTGSSHTDLIDKMGTFASNANIKGSEEQKLLLQSGINPNEFAKMNSLERFNTLMKMFENKGKDLPFRQMLEELTGISGKTLESLLSKRDMINKDFSSEKEKIKDTMGNKSFEETARNWDRLQFTLSDTLARIAVELTPLFEKLLKIVNDFISSGGLGKAIETTKNFFNTIANSEYTKKLSEVFTKLKPVFGFLGDLLKVLGSFAIEGATSILGFISNMIDKVKILFKTFPLQFDNFILSIQEGISKLELKAFEFADWFVSDEKIEAKKKEIEIIQNKRESNNQQIDKVINQITLENKIQYSDINQQSKNTIKAYK